MDWFYSKLQAYNSRVAFCESQKSWTYAEFLNRVGQLRVLIEQKLGSSPSVVALQLGSIFEGLAAILALGDCKHMMLPLANDLSRDERKDQITIAGASWLLEEGELREISDEKAIPALMQTLVTRNHAGLILFSSGSTGEPKGMVHDWSAFLDPYRRVGSREDRVIQLLYPDHVAGLDAALRSILAGSTLIIPETRTPEAVGRAIERHRANVLPATPSFLNLLLVSEAKTRFDCSSLDLIAYGSELMPEAVLKRLTEAFPSVDLQQKFGTSETGAVRIKSRSRDSLEFRIADGNIDWKVVNEELWLRADARILGYLNADGRSLEAEGWYRTGDLVEVLDSDWMRMKGRKETVINVGGYKVHPAEVERLIGEIEGIQSCKVFGEVTPLTGMQVACRVSVSGSPDLREVKRRIRRHCKGRLADWKIPARVHLQSQSMMNRRMKCEDG
ncbi:MAG: class I adenylate-forming enzyme family protein [Opitutales bacterium]